MQYLKSTRSKRVHHAHARTQEPPSSGARRGQTMRLKRDASLADLEHSRLLRGASSRSRVPKL